MYIVKFNKNNILIEMTTFHFTLNKEILIRVIIGHEHVVVVKALGSF